MTPQAQPFFAVSVMVGGTSPAGQAEKRKTDSLFNPSLDYLLADKSCFGAGTLIHTKNGLVPIEEISVGDLVLSQSENKGPLSYKPVTNTFVYYNVDVHLIEFTSRVEFDRAMSLRTMLSPEATNWIVVTGSHPFFVKDRGWVEARNLGSASEIELSDGNYALSTFNAPIYYSGRSPQTGFAPLDYQWTDGGYLAHFWPGPLKIGHIHGSPKSGAQLPCMPRTVYNLEVQDNHTYYVGAMGMLVGCK